MENGNKETSPIKNVDTLGNALPVNETQGSQKPAPKFTFEGEVITITEIDQILNSPEMRKYASMDSADKTVNTKVLEGFKVAYERVKEHAKNIKSNIEKNEEVPFSRRAMTELTLRTLVKVYESVIKTPRLPDTPLPEPETMPPMPEILSEKSEALTILKEDFSNAVALERENTYTTLVSLKQLHDEVEYRIRKAFNGRSPKKNIDGYTEFRKALTEAKNILRRSAARKLKGMSDEEKSTVRSLCEKIEQSRLRIIDASKAVHRNRIEADSLALGNLEQKKNVGSATVSPLPLDVPVADVRASEPIVEEQKPKPNEPPLSWRPDYRPAPGMAPLAPKLEKPVQPPAPEVLKGTLQDAIEQKPVEKPASEEGFAALKIALLDGDNTYKKNSLAYYDNNRWVGDFAHLGRAAGAKFSIGDIPKELVSQEQAYIEAMQKFRDNFEQRYRERLARTSEKNVDTALIDFRRSFVRKYLTERIQTYQAIKEHALPESKKTPLMLLKIAFSRIPRPAKIVLGATLVGGSAVLTGGTSLIALALGLAAKEGVEVAFTGKLTEAKDARDASIIYASATTVMKGAFQNIKRTTEIEEAIKSSETLAKYVAGITTGVATGGALHAAGIDLTSYSPFSATPAHAAVSPSKVLSPSAQASVLGSAPLGDVSGPQFDALPAHETLAQAKEVLMSADAPRMDIEEALHAAKHEIVGSLPEVSAPAAFIYHAPDTGGLEATTWEGTKAFVREIDPSVDLRTQEEITQYFVERFLDNHPNVAEAMGVAKPHYIVQAGQDIPFPAEASAWLHKAVELVKAGNGLVEVNPDGTFVNDYNTPNVYVPQENVTPVPKIPVQVPDIEHRDLVEPEPSLVTPPIPHPKPLIISEPVIQIPDMPAGYGVNSGTDYLSPELNPGVSEPEPNIPQAPINQPEIVPTPNVVPDPIPDPIPTPSIENAANSGALLGDSTARSALLGGAMGLIGRARRPITRQNNDNIKKVLRQLEYAIEEQNGKLLDNRFFKVVSEESVLDKIYNMKQEDFNALGSMAPALLVDELKKREINPELFIKWRNYFAQQPLYKPMAGGTIGENLKAAAEAAITAGTVQT